MEEQFPLKRPGTLSIRPKKKPQLELYDLEELTQKLKSEQEFPEPMKIEEVKAPDTLISGLKEYAGENIEKYRLRDFYVYKQTGIFPREFFVGEDKRKISEKKRGFKLTSRNYIISDKEISNVTKSKLCYYLRSEENLRVIPFKDELPTVMRNIHVRNGVHTSLKRCLQRAIKIKVYWPQYCDDFARYINACTCRCAHKLKVN